MVQGWKWKEMNLILMMFCEASLLAFTPIALAQPGLAPLLVTPGENINSWGWSIKLLVSLREASCYRFRVQF